MRNALEMGPDDIDFSLDHVDIETDLGDDTPTDPVD
jgi:hypothetical protein